MVVVRSARAFEQQRLADIGYAAWADAVASWGEDVAALSAGARRAYDAFVRESWGIILAAELDTVLAGWGACEDGRNTISDLWIDPACQNRGAGTALLAALEGDIRGFGYDCAEMSTHARNTRAIDLCKRRGYSVTALSVRYSPSLDRDIETVSLRKVFAE